MTAGVPKSLASATTGHQDPEDVFRLLVEQVADYAIVLLDLRGRVSSWNVGAQRINGYAPAEILGSPFSVFFSEEDRAQGEPARILEVAGAEGRHEEEGWRVRKDGSRFWAHGVLTALHDQAGRLHGFVKITRDLTERLRAEEAARRLSEERATRMHHERSEQERRLQLRRQNELSALRADVSGVAVAGGDAAHLLDHAVRAVVQRLGVAAARVWLFDDEGTLRLQANAGRELPGHYSSAQLSASIVGRIAETGAPASCGNLSADPGFGALWDPKSPIAFAGCPLLALGRGLGVLGAFGRGALPEDTLDALRGVADVLAHSLERRRAEADLRRSRDRLAVILATISDGVTAQSTDGRLLFANEAAARLTGFDSTGEMMGAPVREILDRFEIRDERGVLLPPSELPGRRALVEGQPSQITVRFRNRIDLPSTVHWHGVRLDNAFDGAADLTQEPVPSGGSFVYRVHFPDAGIYWYHPHVREDIEQAMGLFVVFCLLGPDGAVDQGLKLPPGILEMDGIEEPANRRLCSVRIFRR